MAADTNTNTNKMTRGSPAKIKTAGLRQRARLCRSGPHKFAPTGIEPSSAPNSRRDRSRGWGRLLSCVSDTYCIVPHQV